MNEQFVNELATALRKVGTIHTVGEEWVSYIGEIPVGGVPYTGQMVTRATYSALWTYAQAKGLVKTEAEWQQIATANNGNVPFYSDGDGSTTFRMPKIVGYVKGASSQSVAGDYVKEGLPNITGNLTTENASDMNFISDASMGQIGESGAFYISRWTNKYVTSKGGTSLYSPVALDFNASYSNPIYGNSEHVTPETSTVLFGVYAFGAIVESGELDATTLQTGLARVESSLGGYLPLSGGNVTGNLTVQSKNVVRSINGTSADVDGNVTVEANSVGTIIATGAISAPSGYLLCNGSAVSRTTYANLFAKIGTTYGSGDGSTTFNLPNMGTSLVSDVTTGDVPVAGNGISLGFTNGDQSFPFVTGGNPTQYVLSGVQSNFGTPIGTSCGFTASNGSRTIGITSDSSKSGLVAKMTATKTTVKYYIKY